jgi:hypothetical protein
MGHLDGLRLLFSFYWNNFWRFQRELPVWLRNPVRISAASRLCRTSLLRHGNRFQDVFNTLLGEHRTHHSKEEVRDMP